MKMQGPIEVEMKVHITDWNGTTGVVTVGFSKGSFPSEEQMRDTLESLGDSLPDGFRVMTKREYWDELMPPIVSGEDQDGEIYTSRFAVPGDEQEWDK